VAAEGADRVAGLRSGVVADGADRVAGLRVGVAVAGADRVVGADGRTSPLPELGRVAGVAGTRSTGLGWLGAALVTGAGLVREGCVTVRFACPAVTGAGAACVGRVAGDVAGRAGGGLSVRAPPEIIGGRSGAVVPDRLLAAGARWGATGWRASCVWRETGAPPPAEAAVGCGR